MKQKHFIFTDCDLDGAGCYMMWPWFLGTYPDRITTRVNDFEKSWKQWIAKGNLNKYDRIFITDLDISRIDCLDLVDIEKVTIIDHHKSHVENKHKYKNATTYIKTETSCSKIVYNLFKKTGKKLDANKKFLISLIDDYDSYKLSIPHSYHLNLLFWNYQGDRLKQFINDYKNGFTPFTDEQKKIISFYLKKLKNIKKDLDVHWAYLPVGDTNCKFVSVFATECINEIADHIINNYKADVGIVINCNSSKVSLRRSKDSQIKLNDLASQLFDEGGGHEEAAGGILCDKFLEFSKSFAPMKIKLGS